VNLPPAIADEVHTLRLQVAALADVVARLALTPEDRDTLELLLYGLGELRPGVVVGVAEVLALAATAPGAAGDALREAVRRFDGRDAGCALGWFVRRAADIPMQGRILRRLGPPHSKAPALFYVQAFGR
jgi:hypothetical protein